MAELGESLRSFGATDEQIAELCQARAVRDFDLWPENAPAMRLFLAMATQWRVGFSGAIGLDYAALPVVEQRLGVKHKKSLFAGLQVLERAVLDLIKKHG